MDLDFLAMPAPTTSQPPVRSPYRNDEPVEGEDHSKRIPWTTVSVIGGVVLIMLLASGIYWWSGRPTSVQIASYEAFLRAGNELIDMQMSFETGEDLYASESRLREKAREMLAAKEKCLSVTGRRKASLEERFKERQGNLKRRATELISSGKPGALLSPDVLAHGSTDYREFGWPSRKAAPVKPAPVNPAPFDPSARLRQIAGVWDAKDFSFTIGPDGQGTALLIGNFSQGTGNFSVKDKNGLPVELTASFQVKFQGEEPRWTFNIEPTPGLNCKYSFAVLPSTGSDSLVVKELGGGRIEPNPTTMKRRLAAPAQAVRADREVEGEWKMETGYLVYTGQESQQMIMKSDIMLRIGAGSLEYSGRSGGTPLNAKLNVTFDSTATPKRFRMVDPGDRNDFQEGVYRVDGDVLLMRTLKRGSAKFSLDLESDSVRLDKNASGKDSDVPLGFLMRKGDPDTIFRYVRVKTGSPEPAPKAVDLSAAVKSLEGTWDAKNLTLTIRPDGSGTAVAFAEGSGAVTAFFGYFKVAIRNGAPNIAFSIVSGATKREFDFTVLTSKNPDEIVVKEAAGQVTPNPLTLKRRPPVPEEKWEAVASDGSQTRSVVTVKNGFYAMYGGEVAIEARDVPGKGFQATPILDAPGSLWLIAKGGITWKGEKFPEGSIAAVDNRRVAKLTKGEYGAWFIAKSDIPVYSQPDGSGPSIATVKANTSFRILIPDSDSKGLHKVRLDDGAKTEGWVRATWDKLAFKKRIGNGATPPKPIAPVIDLATALRTMQGKWEGGDMTFTIEADGNGLVTAKVLIGTDLSISGSRFQVTMKEKQPNISFRLGSGGRARDYNFTVTLGTDPDEMVLKEASDLVKPNPLSMRRQGSAKPVIKPVDGKSYPAAPPSGTIGLSDLHVTKTTFNPPSVEFTIRLHDEGGDLLEAWASVGVPDPSELVKTCAGAIDQGLLSVNGIDFANPDPSLKVQRVSFKKGKLPGELIGTVQYPKVVLDGATVEFGLAAAVKLKGKIEKTNAAVMRLDLKTGTVLPRQPMAPGPR